MAHRLRTKKDPDAWVGVSIHPELHKLLKLSATKHGGSLRKRMHDMLCRELNRPDLLSQVSEPSLSESTTRG